VVVVFAVLKVTMLVAGWRVSADGDDIDSGDHQGHHVHHIAATTTVTTVVTIALATTVLPSLSVSAFTILHPPIKVWCAYDLIDLRQVAVKIHQVPFSF
jgi:hypothetical protein